MVIFSEASGVSMYRARFPQRLSNVHIAITIGVLVIFIISSSYHHDVKTYLDTHAVSNSHHQDYSISVQDDSKFDSVGSGRGRGYEVPSHDITEHGSEGHAISGHSSPDHVHSPIHEDNTFGQVHPEANSLVHGSDQGHKPPSHDAPGQSSSAQAVPPRIPNIVHFTQISSDPNAAFTFDFRQCLSIYSAWFHMHPDTIFIHTNATHKQVESARRGKEGKWVKLVLDLPNVVVNQEEMATHAGNGVQIEWLAHASDFLRVEMAKKYGGTYLDTDVYTLQDLKPLRESNFGAVAARTEAYDHLNSGQWMTEPNGKVISAWQEEMHKVFVGTPYGTDGWARASDVAFRKVAHELFGEAGGHILILEERAFTPGRIGHTGDPFFGAIPALYGWNSEHPNPAGVFTNDLTNFTQGDSLPDFEAAEANGERPPWSEDWSTSYLFHAFMAHEEPLKSEYISTWTGGRYQRLTPRYVLERQTRFARALYPVAKHMYDTGVLHVDDFDMDKEK